MTDRDIVERVATAFATTATSISRAGRRTIYATRIKGSRAVLLMRDLAPGMSQRRGQAIQAALDAHCPPQRRLDLADAETIRALRIHGTSVSSLARTFGVSRPTIRQVLDRSIYPAPALTPWRLDENPSHSLSEIDAGVSLPELYWLAGWLEGEGSFVRPPPSDPRRVRILARTRDHDVAREVGRLLGVEPLFSHDARERRLGWSATWRLLARGQGAAQMMRAVHPLMGSRRQSQIESALAATELI